MLGDRLLGMGAQVGGSLADFGGNLTYMSRRHRWNWATSLESTPFRVRYLTLDQDPATKRIILTQVTERQTSRGLFGIAAFPLSGGTRLEFSGGARDLTFTRETEVQTYSADTQNLLDRSKTSEDLAAPLRLAEASAAIVRDTSLFGATGPVYGGRSRLEVGQSVGTLRYSTLSLDWRHYWMPKRPVTIGARVVHLGRYGSDAEHPQLIPLYVGHPEFVHGYGLGSFDATDRPKQAAIGPCAIYDNLLGSRILVTNFEARMPLRGLFTESSIRAAAGGRRRLLRRRRRVVQRDEARVRRRHPQCRAKRGRGVAGQSLRALHHRTGRVAPVRSPERRRAVAGHDATGLLNRTALQCLPNNSNCTLASLKHAPPAMSVRLSGTRAFASSR